MVNENYNHFVPNYNSTYNLNLIVNPEKKGKPSKSHNGNIESIIKDKTKKIKNTKKKDLKQIKIVKECLKRKEKKPKLIKKLQNIMIEAFKPEQKDLDQQRKLMLNDPNEEDLSSALSKGEGAADKADGSEDHMYFGLETVTATKPTLLEPAKIVSDNDLPEICLFKEFKGDVSSELKIPTPLPPPPRDETLEQEFFGENRLVKGYKQQGSDFSDNHLLFYANQGLLEEYAKKEGVDEETKSRLRLAAAQGMGKAAPLSLKETTTYERQISPLNAQALLYHRSHDNKFIDDVNAEYSPLFKGANAYVIDNPKQVCETLDRQKTVLPINSIEDFKALLTDLHTKTEQKSLWIDFTPLLGRETNQEKVNDVLKDLQKIVADCFANPELKHPNRVKLLSFLANIHLIAFVNDGDLKIMLASDNFLFIDREKLFRSFSKDEMEPFYRFQGREKEMIQLMLSGTGGMPTMDRSKEVLLKRVKIDNEDFSPFTDITLSAYSVDVLKPRAVQEPEALQEPRLNEFTFKKFFEQPVVKGFKQLGTVKGAPPFLEVLTEATWLLWKEFETLDIDKKFEEKGLTGLLPYSYHVMLTAMQDAVSRFPKDKGEFIPLSPEQKKKNFIAFMNDLEVLHLGIQNILCILQPYNDQALAESSIKYLRSTSVIPPDLADPIVVPKASAMRVFSSALASVEKQYIADKKKGEINTLVLKDSYYESTGLLGEAKNYHVTKLEGDKFTENDENTIHDIAEELGNKKLDLFLCEFEHNISLDRVSYKVEKVKEQVKALFNHDIAADKLTVIIDTTLDLVDSNHIKTLLEDSDIKKLIKEGKLNIVLNRSAQKFDMVGQDNYSGGIATVFNEPKAFSAFNERMTDKDDQLTGLSYQGLTHLLSHQEMIDKYRRKVMENTRKLYDAIPKEAIYVKDSTSRTQVSEIETTQPLFLDIKFPNRPSLANKFVNFLHRFASKNELFLTQRSSFGFANTNLTVIGEEKIRINPGLEDEEVIKKYAEFFSKWSKYSDTL